jgi:hypothetical protein
MGAVYGFISPSEMMDKGAGVWQSYDITLIGRRITLAMNGKSIICDGEIPGITVPELPEDESENDHRQERLQDRPSDEGWRQH